MTTPSGDDEDRRLARAAEAFVVAAAARARARDAEEPAEAQAKRDSESTGEDQVGVARADLFPVTRDDDAVDRRAARTNAHGPRPARASVPPASEGVARRRWAPIGEATPLPGRVLGPGEWAAAVRSEAARWHRFGRPAAFVTLGLSSRDPGEPPRDDPEAAERYAIPLGETLRRRARASDPVVRLDARCFAVMLLHADARGAASFATRISAACEPWVRAVPGDLAMDIAWAVPGRGDRFEDVAAGLLSDASD